MVQIVISEEGIREIARDLYASVEGDLKQALSDLNRIIKEDLTSMHNLYLSLQTDLSQKHADLDRKISESYRGIGDIDKRLQVKDALEYYIVVYDSYRDFGNSELASVAPEDVIDEHIKGEKDHMQKKLDEAKSTGVDGQLIDTLLENMKYRHHAKYALKTIQEMFWTNRETPFQSTEITPEIYDKLMESLINNKEAEEMSLFYSRIPFYGELDTAVRLANEIGINMSQLKWLAEKHHWLHDARQYVVHAGAAGKAEGVGYL